MKDYLFSRRITAFAAFFFLLCSFFTAYFRLDAGKLGIVISAGLFLLLLVLSIFVSKNRKYKIRRFGTTALYAAVLCGAVALSVTVNSLLVLSAQKKAAVFDGIGTTATCEITEVISDGSSYFSNYEVVFRNIGGENAGIRGRIEVNHPAGLSVGDIVELEGTFSIPDEDREIYCLPDGVLLIADVESPITVVGEIGKTLMSFIRELGDSIESNFDNILSENGAELSSALLIGRKDDLSFSFIRDIKRLGISHLLALSGMHLTLLCAGLGFLLSLCRVGKTARCIILIVFSVFYAILTGLSPSIVRASAMLVLSNLAFLVGRRYDALTALLLSVAGIVIFSPFSVYDVGLVLSFLSMLSIVCISAPLASKAQALAGRAMPKFVSAVIAYVTYSVASGIFAWIFTLPVMIVVFGEVSLVSVIMTLLFSLPVELYIILSVLLAVFSACRLTALEAPIARITDAFAEFITDSAARLSKNPNICIAVNYNFARAAAVFLLIAVFAVILVCRKRRELKILVCAAVSIGIIIGGIALYNRQTRDEVRIIYANYSESDFICLSSDTEVLLCEISNGGYSKLRQAYYDSKELHFTEIDTFLVTDYHYHSRATLERLLSDVIVGKVMLPEVFVSEDRDVQSEMIAVAEDAGVEWEIYSFGDFSETYGKCRVEAVEKRMLSRSVKPSVVLRLSLGDTSLYYLGASFWEDYTAETDGILSDAAGVILGHSGPIVKTEFSPRQRTITASDGVVPIILK